jgi:hypothetical protein
MSTEAEPVKDTQKSRTCSPWQFYRIILSLIKMNQNCFQRVKAGGPLMITLFVGLVNTILCDTIPFKVLYVNLFSTQNIYSHKQK